MTRDGGGADDPPAPVRTRAARPADRAAVRSVLDAALLETDDLPELIADERVLLAERLDGGPPLGVLVAPGRVPDADRPEKGVPGEVGAHVAAVAVRPGRRGQGIGSALVVAAGERWGRLTAAYEPDLAPFYEELEFVECATLADGRLFGVRESA